MIIARVIVSMREPIEYARQVICEHTNQVWHPESIKAQEDAQLWDATEFIEGVVALVFHYNRHAVDIELGLPHAPVVQCRHALSNVGLHEDLMDGLINRTSSFVIDELAHALPIISFSESHLNEFEFISPTDIVVTTTCWTLPSPTSAYQYVQGD